jgi:hypothetical protein
MQHRARDEWNPDGINPFYPSVILHSFDNYLIHLPLHNFLLGHPKEIFPCTYDSFWSPFPPYTV